MDRGNRDELDGRIDAALREEELRDVPAGFHRRVQERLRMAALLRREQRRFRLCMTATGAIAGALLLVGGIAWFMGDLPGAVARSIPGALGFYDHLVAVLTRHWPRMAAGVFGFTLVLGVAVFLLESLVVNRKPA